MENKNMILDLESNLGKIGTKDIMFQDINSIIDDIIDNVNKLLNRNFEYETNLAQHLSNYKKENDLSKLSEKDKIVNFVEYLHKKEFDYVDNYKTDILNGIDFLSTLLSTQICFIEEKVRDCDSKKDKSSWYNFSKKNQFEQNKEIYEFKDKNLMEINHKLTRLKGFISKIHNNIVKKHLEEENKTIDLFDNLSTLEQFILDNEYSKSTPDYLKLGTLDKEIKSELLDFKNNLISFKKSINNKPTYEQIDLMANRLANGNILTSTILRSLNKVVLKPFNLLSIKKNITWDKLYYGSITLLIATGIATSIGKEIKIPENISNLTNIFLKNEKFVEQTKNLVNNFNNESLNKLINDNESLNKLINDNDLQSYFKEQYEYNKISNQNLNKHSKDFIIE